MTILYNYSKESNINKNSFLIVGEPPQIIYPNIFKMENYKEINNYKVENEYLNFFSKVSHYISWSIEINKISFNNRNINNNSYIGVFYLDYIPFLLPIKLFNAYIDTYLMTYINNNVCYKKGRPLSRKYTHSVDKDKSQIFIFVYCEKNNIQNISKFYNSMPVLKFRNELLNKTFEFSSQELFVEENDGIYLMLIPDMFNKMKITFGKIFMEKYHFTFNYDSNKIGFYDCIINI